MYNISLFLIEVCFCLFQGDVDSMWTHDLYDTASYGGLRSTGGGSGSGKLLISNLDFGVSNSDIKVIVTC